MFQRTGAQALQAVGLSSILIIAWSPEHHRRQPLGTEQEGDMASCCPQTLNTKQTNKHACTELMVICTDMAGF